MAVQVSPASGEPKTPFQPAPRLAGSHGAHHRGGGPGIAPFAGLRDVEIQPGGPPASVGVAKLQNALPHKLGKAGIGPRDVKRVVLTHLHMDHDGGLAHFPNTEIMVSRGEFNTSIPASFANADAGL